MQLRKEFKLRPEDIQPGFDSITLIKSGFNEFPQIAHNDFTIDQMNLVRAAEDNLNANNENTALAQKLIETV